MSRTGRICESQYNIQASSHLMHETMQSLQGELSAFRQWLKKRHPVSAQQDVLGFIDSIATRNNVFLRELNKVIRTQNINPNAQVDVDTLLQAQVLKNIQLLLKDPLVEQKLTVLQRSLWGEFRYTLEKLENNIGKAKTYFRVEKTYFEQLDR